MRLSIVLILALFALHTHLHAGGNAYITNFKQTDYMGHAQNWCVAQDKRGIIYVANSNRLMTYTGNSWEGFDVLKGTKVYSLALGNEGEIFLGGIGNFGYLKPEKNGKLVYHSLSLPFEKQDLNFGEIWSIITIDNHVIFFSKACIFDYSNGKIKCTYPPTDFFFHKIFKFQNKCIVRVKGKGLYYYSDCKLTSIPNTESFSEMSLDFLVEKNEHTVLLGTRAHGLFTYDFKSCKLESLPVKISDELKEASVYHGTLLHDRTVAIATKNKGIYFMSLAGEMIEHITQKENLINDNVWYVFEDNQKNIWAATDKGISIIHYFLPFRVFNESYRLKGNVNATVEYNHVVYIATTQGLYSLKNDSIVNQITSGNVNCLQNIVVANHQVCLGGGINGVFVIDPKGAINYLDHENVSEVFKITQSKYNRKIIFIGKNSELEICQIANEKLQLIKKIELPSNIESIVETKKGDLFIGLIGKGVYNFKIDNYREDNLIISEPTIIKIRDSILCADSRYCLAVMDNVCYVGTRSGLFFIENKQLKIGTNLDSIFNKTTRDVYNLSVDNENRFWVSSLWEDKYEFGILKKNSYNDIQYYHTLFKSFPQTQINSTYIKPFEFCLFSTNEGLIKYEFKKKFNPNFFFNSILCKVISSTGDTIFGGYEMSPDKATTQVPLNNPMTLEYSKNSLRFEYSATNYLNTKGIYYRTKLIGYDDSFSSWTLETQRSYTKIPEGSYTFVVLSKDIFGNISKVSKYSFTIRPPWYRLPITYVVYFILLVLTIRSFFLFNTRRLKQKNEQLEKIVQERTYEIVEQKNKIEETNKVLAIKKQEITESIVYAKHIQDSILPENELFSDHIKSSFVLFKPKDIVSGDFYAFYQKQDEYIIAVVDCTGHGVPGALMSMLGSNLLNQIINEKQITKPSEILYHLNLSVNQSLKQNKNKGNDGMDIAVIHMCPHEKNNTSVKLEYAGANRPLYLIRNAVLEEIKATKKPIGGVLHEDRHYQNHEFVIEKGTMIYLTTDGYADQFGGPFNKKITTKKFKELLLDINSLDLQIQKNKLETFFENWKKNEEQIDDVCVLGLRI